MVFMKRLSFKKKVFAGLTILMFFMHLSFAGIAVDLRPNKAKLGDILHFSLKIDQGSMVKMSDILPILSDFHIVGSQTRTSYSSVNGRSNLVTELMILLTPKKQGTLTIAALNLGGESTKPLTVEVSEAGTSPDT